MIEEVVPAGAVEIAFWTFVVVARVACVLVEGVVGSKGAIAAVAPPSRCQWGEG